MDQKPELQELQQSLSSAQSILIAIPQNPSLDKIAASLSLYLSLKKRGKTTSIICAQPMTVEFSQLVGVDKVVNKIQGKNLVVSFDYLKDSVEKVSYNVEGNKFNLVIQPKAGLPPLGVKNVNYTYTGIDSDLIFIIGAQKLEDLSKLYEDEKDFYHEKPVVNIGYHQKNEQFGKINIFYPQASSYSEIIVLVLKTLNFPLNEDIAGNLLMGIKSATNNFQSPRVSGETFEAAALCLRSGAKQSAKEQLSLKKEKKMISSPDWLTPKIYKGATRV
jgi:nanoRNase/pAp phosphatase (c-di-AMP/oligoRNAs hydrolase)